MEPVNEVSPSTVTLEGVKAAVATENNSVSLPAAAVAVPVAVPVPVAAAAAVAVAVPAAVAVAAAVAVPVAAAAAVAVPVPVAAAVAAPVPAAIYTIVESVTKDEKFLATVKVSVDKILKDGKIDQSDIPELVFIISETVNALGTFNLTVDTVPVVIKMIYKFIVDKYNLVPEDKKADFERIVDSSLRLLMFQPNIRKELNACFAFLTCSK